MSILSKRRHAIDVKRWATVLMVVAGLCLVIPLASLQSRSEGAAPAMGTTIDQSTPASDSEALPGPDEFVAVDSVPQMIKETSPVFPDEAKDAGVQGKVYIRALVDKTGKVRDVRILKSSGHKELDDAAVTAAWDNEFRPAKQNGKPVAVWVAYSVDFTLAEKPKENN